MIVLETDNVHQVFPRALRILLEEGVRRESRNGDVLQYPTPVSTVYLKPQQRVIFWPKRDANPFFHLYESLWMLAGRCDVKGVVRYAANMADYSDYGEVFHGAYGHRWRKHFGFDQLEKIAVRLSNSKTDRRAVLAMWDANIDLAWDDKGKDYPCNDTATFQVNADGKLDLVVFCRSNDIVWGCYGANAVQFSILLEYMAHWIGVPMGTYTQISVNWHGYTKILDKVDVALQAAYNPYHYVKAFPIATPDLSHEELDQRVNWLLFQADHEFPPLPGREFNDDQPFWEAAYIMLRAHLFYKTQGKQAGLDILSGADQSCDWVVAGKEWLERRKK